MIISTPILVRFLCPPLIPTVYDYISMLLSCIYYWCNMPLTIGIPLINAPPISVSAQSSIPRSAKVFETNSCSSFGGIIGRL